MSYCSRCGVEVESQIKNCPLCDAPIQHLEEPTGSRSWMQPTDDKLFRAFPTSVDIKNRVYLFLTTLLVMASLILWAVDFIDDNSLTWSWIPTSGILAGFFYLTVFFNLYKSFLRLTLGLMGSTVFLLSTLNYLTGAQWFFPLGLPIIVGLQILFTFSFAVIKNFKIRGYNIFGLFFAVVAVFLILVDGLIHLYGGTWTLSWSIITSFSLFPFCLYFFFLHYGLHRVLDLTRSFHF